MSEAINTDQAAHPSVEVEHLPVYCPNPAMPIWNHHPKVFLDVTKTGSAACPYCGTQYRLKAGTTVHSH